MRYTTIIDISEFPALYKNHATRLVYLHLCLRSGYHDYDRDIAQLSIRRLSYETGLSIAAVRNALAQLGKFQMIRRQGELLQVRKFILEQPISKRGKTKRQEQAAQAAQERAVAHNTMKRERQERQAMVDDLRAQGKTSFMVYYEQQQAAAAAGDPNAIAFVEANKRIYEQHQKSIKQ